MYEIHKISLTNTHYQLLILNNTGGYILLAIQMIWKSKSLVLVLVVTLVKLYSRIALKSVIPTYGTACRME